MVYRRWEAGHSYIPPGLWEKARIQKIEGWAPRVRRIFHWWLPISEMGERLNLLWGLSVVYTYIFHYICLLLCCNLFLWFHKKFHAVPKILAVISVVWEWLWVLLSVPALSIPITWRFGAFRAWHLLSTDGRIVSWKQRDAGVYMFTPVILGQFVQLWCVQLTNLRKTCLVLCFSTILWLLHNAARVLRSVSRLEQCNQISF